MIFFIPAIMIALMWVIMAATLQVKLVTNFNTGEAALSAHERIPVKKRLLKSSATQFFALS